MTNRKITITNLKTGKSRTRDFWKVYAEIVKNHPSHQLLIQSQKKLQIGNNLYEQA